MPTTVVDTIAALADEHSPAPVLVLASSPSLARWTARLLADRGAVVGVRCFDAERLINEACAALGLRFVPEERVLRWVGEALDSRPELALVAEQASYQRAVADLFVELERVGAEPNPAGNARDQALLAAFDVYRAQRDADEEMEHRVDRGQALQAVLARADEVPWLRDAATAVAIGFDPDPEGRPAWLSRLMERLGATPVARPPAEIPVPPPVVERRVADGPEPEIAAVARSLRMEPGRSAVLVPGDEVARWVARLHHREIPTRAWISRSVGGTASAQGLTALLRCVRRSRVARRDLRVVLFGSALAPFAATNSPAPAAPGSASIEESAVPRRVLETIFRRQRRISGRLADYVQRLREDQETQRGMILERAGESEWTDAETARRLATIDRSHGLLIRALQRLETLRTGADVVALLGDWRAMARARTHRDPTLEVDAVRRIVSVLERLAAHDLDACETAVLSALERASSGSWVDDGGAGMAPVWVLPYDAIVDDLPPRVYACGLDRHPAPPEPGFLLSPATREHLGLVTPHRRHAQETARLDAIAATGSLIASRRNRDGTGSRCPPGSWIARRPPSLDEAERRIPLAAIAVPVEPSACTSLERRIFVPGVDAELERRVTAIRSHENDALGPHTGDLGVRTAPVRPYSASSLQTFARIPYLYFVRRVLGIDEVEELEDALSAIEHGTLVHAAMERTFAARLGDGPVDARALGDTLRSEALQALQTEFTRHAEGSLAAAVWHGDVNRWTHELERWWSDFERRYERARDRPGAHVVAVELSLGRGDQPHVLSIGGRRVPITAKIDRLERDPEVPGLIVVDYKTGWSRSRGAVERDLREGIHLQLPLYAMAIDTLADAPDEQREGTGVEAGERARAIRLEQFKRGRGSGSRGPAFSSPAFDLDDPVGEDPSGQPVTLRDCTANFTAAFVAAIEAGQFPLVHRTPPFSKPRRNEQALRVIPEAGREIGLPAPLERLGSHARRGGDR